MGVQEPCSPHFMGAKPSPEPPAGPGCGGSGGTEQHLPGQAGRKGLKVVPTERKHVSVCTAGSSNEKKQRGRGKRWEKGRSCSPKAAPPPGRSAGSRPLRGVPPSSTERRLVVQTVPVVSCTQPAREHRQQPRAHLSRVVRGRPDGAGKRSGAFRRARTLARRGATRACRSACPRAGWFFPRERQRGERAGGRLFIWPVW